MTGYNDDLVISFGIALWIRDTALRLRVEGIELQKKAISGITMNPAIYTPTEENDSWKWEIDKKKEDLTWLIK